MRDARKLAKQKKKTQLYKIIKEVMESYFKERKHFYNFSSLKDTQSSKNSVEESYLDNLFKLDDGRNILLLDKGLGYTVI